MKCYFSKVVEQKKGRNKRECSIHEKTHKTVPLPAITIILTAGVGNDAKTIELLWENCTLKLKMMTEVKYTGYL